MRRATLTWKRETWVVALLDAGRASTASVKMLHVHWPISSGVTFIYAHNTSNNLMRIHHRPRRGSIRSSDLLQFDTFHNVPYWLVDFRWWCCPASARRRSTPRSNSWWLDLEFGTPAKESDLFWRWFLHRLVIRWRCWVPLKHVVNKWCGIIMRICLTLPSTWSSWPSTISSKWNAMSNNKWKAAIALSF